MTIVFRLSRAARYAAFLGIAIFAAPPPAAATPVIKTFKVRAIPIPGVPGTGDRLGAGIMLEGSTSISGSEYAGSPAPVIGATFLAPLGMQVHPSGFATCSAVTLEQQGPESCPKRSVAGPTGSALGDVTFEEQRVPERVSLQTFFAPGGGMEVLVEGHTPVSLAITAKGHIAPAPPPFGLEFVAEIPLIVTLPGAPDASFLEGSIEVGAGYRQGARTVSYLTLPKRCGRHGWTVEEQLRFLGGGEARASSTMRCPSR